MERYGEPLAMDHALAGFLAACRWHGLYEMENRIVTRESLGDRRGFACEHITDALMETIVGINQFDLRIVAEEIPADQLY